MTAPRRPRTRTRTALAVLGASALFFATACASATDVAGTAPETGGSSSDTPLRTLPPTTGSPTPTPTETTPTAAAPPKAGECREPSTVDSTLRVSDDETPPVACKGATSYTYHVRTMPAAVKAAVTAYDTTRIVNAARGTCEKAAASYLGADKSDYKRSQFDFIVGVPSASETAAGASWMRCDLVLPASATKLSAVPAKTKNALKGKTASRYMQCVRGDIRRASGTVPCSTKHQWRGVGSVKLGSPKAKYAGAKKVQATMKSRCGSVVRSYLNTRDSFQYGYISPSKTSWQRGERWGVCFAKTSS